MIVIVCSTHYSYSWKNMMWQYLIGGWNRGFLCLILMDFNLKVYAFLSQKGSSLSHYLSIFGPEKHVLRFSSIIYYGQKLLIKKIYIYYGQKLKEKVFQVWSMINLCSSFSSPLIQSDIKNFGSPFLQLWCWF